MAGFAGNLSNEGEAICTRRVFLDVRLFLGHDEEDAETGVVGTYHIS